MSQGTEADSHTILKMAKRIWATKVISPHEKHPIASHMYCSRNCIIDHLPSYSVGCSRREQITRAVAHIHKQYTMDEYNISCNIQYEMQQYCFNSEVTVPFNILHAKLNSHVTCVLRLSLTEEMQQCSMFYFCDKIVEDQYTMYK